MFTIAEMLDGPSLVIIGHAATLDGAKKTALEHLRAHFGALEFSTIVEDDHAAGGADILAYVPELPSMRALHIVINPPSIRRIENPLTQRGNHAA